MIGRAVRAALLVLVVALGAGPVLFIVGQAVLRGSLAGIEARAVFGSLGVALGAAALALAVGLPLAILLERTDLPLARLWRAGFLLPFAVPPYLIGMGWVLLAAPKVGYLNRALFDGFNVYGHPGMAFVLGTAALPLVLLPSRAALASADASLEEAARLAGASPLRALREVTVPLVLPAALSGAALAFLFAASAFGVPYLLGVVTTPPAVVLTTRIYALLLVGGDQARAQALAMSAALLALGTLALSASTLLSRRGRVAQARGKGTRHRPLALGRYRSVALLAVALLAVVLVAFPVGAVVLSSFQRSVGAALHWDGFTLEHWATVLRSGRARSALARSFGFAAITALLVSAGGVAIALVARRGRAGRALALLAVWPYAVPGTVLAIALIAAYGADLRFVFADRLAVVLALASAGALVVVGYLGKHLALGVRGAADALAQLDPSLAEAARVSGASAPRALFTVVLPLIRPAVGAAFILTFLLCATELTLSVLLVAPGQDVLGTLIFEWQSYAEPAAASVLATVVIALAAAGLWFGGHPGER